MQIMRDQLRLRGVEAGQIGDRAPEGVVGLFGGEVTDVLTNENIPLYAQRDRVLKLRADREDGGLRAGHRNRQRGVAAGSPQHHFPSVHEAQNRIVDVPNDEAIVHEKVVRDAAQAIDRFTFIDANRLVAQVAAGRDNGEIQFTKQEVMERRGGEHDAEVGVSGRNGGWLLVAHCFF
jgi:hypothetical protein